MATDNIFAGTITCTGLTSTGAIIVTGAIASSTGFVGPSLSAASATGTGTVGNSVIVSGTAGTADAGAAGGNGGNAFVAAGAGGTGLTGGVGGSLTLQAGIGGAGSGGTGGSGGSATLQAGAGGATNANGGNVNLIPGAGAGTGRNGEVRVNSSTAGFIPVTFNYYAGAIDTSFFIASRAYRVRSIILRVDVTAGAITALIKKAPSGTAINAGTSISTTAFALDGVAFTNQNGVLSATPADLEIAAGDAIGIDFSGVVAVGAAGSVTVTLAPL